MEGHKRPICQAGAARRTECLARGHRIIAWTSHGSPSPRANATQRRAFVPDHSPAAGNRIDGGTTPCLHPFAALTVCLVGRILLAYPPQVAQMARAHGFQSAIPALCRLATDIAD